MNSPLRRVGIVVLVLFGMLFVNLNFVQAYKADSYRTSPYNGRVQVAEYERARGVVEAQGRALARSQETDGELKYLRQYPDKGLYAHVVGYKPVNLQASNIERSEDEFLAGTSDQFFADRLKEKFTGDRISGGNVRLSLSLAAQRTAATQLSRNRVGAKRGAVVALDPRSGGVQALVSMPTFDPNELVSHDRDAAAAAYKRLEKAPNGPLKNRALAETLPPGSTFKVIDAAAALENGYTPQTAIPAGRAYTPPQTGQVITNAAPSICPEDQVTLREAVRESCNTGFAKLGVRLGAEVLKAKARDFGFEDEKLVCGRIDGGGIAVAPSRTGTMSRPDGQVDPAQVAQSAIGQRDVKMTPMQGALIAATVANGGAQMRPYLVQQLLGPDRRSLYSARPEELRRPVEEGVARDLQDMMVAVVESGTGESAGIRGHRVGGKTGTAQAGVGEEDHGWFIGFALAPDGTPVSAVAVVLEHAGQGGSREAARIAGQVMRAVIGQSRGGGD
ncbi:MAG TPA: penicillin-binding transpeptidase domain-containing protein [Pilimelia sp.]|nr:penicillin-binding transpeptidase domain-containing protein [Pilimelia sp.]